MNLPRHKKRTAQPAGKTNSQLRNPGMPAHRRRIAPRVLMGIAGLAVALVLGGTSMMVAAWQDRTLIPIANAVAGDAGTLKGSGAQANNAAPLSIPITVDLPKQQLVTVVIEDSNGKRVRNLISETLLPAGKNTVTWDGYDDGKVVDGVLTRRRVSPGTYHARGLTHDKIKTIYEFPVYSGGSIPWKTEDDRGAWPADHAQPTGVAFIPAGESPYGDGKPQVIVTALVGECNPPIALVGLDGQTYLHKSFWGWDGGENAAVDYGKDRNTRHAAYVLYTMGLKNPFIIRALSSASWYNTSVTENVVQYMPKNEMPEAPREQGLCLSVNDGLAAFNVPSDNAIVFADVRIDKNKILGSVSVPSPVGVLLISKTSLLVSTGSEVKLLTLTWDASGAPSLQSSTTVISGLEAPHTLQYDLDRKKLYVALWGTSNQIKVFDALTYKQLMVIGEPGKLQVGKYNPLQMQRPEGLAIDNTGQLWVGEADYMPKRISVWDTATGKLVRAHYGPPHYGGGGTIDPGDKSRLFYGEFGATMEFKLDWEAGTSTLVNIPIRPNEQGTEHMMGPFGTCPEVVTRVNGRTYLTLGYQSGLRSNDNFGAWLLDEKTGLGRPVAYVGAWAYWKKPNDVWINDHKVLPWVDQAMKETGSDSPLITWSDLNNNGQMDVSEVKWHKFPQTYKLADGNPRTLRGFWNFAPISDLSMCGSWNVMVSPTFRADGVPIYNLDKAKFMVPPTADQAWPGGEDGNGGLLTEDGFWVQGTSAGYKNGKLIWTYPTDNTTWQTPKFPGDIVEATRQMGPFFKMQRGEAGVVYVTNGERGNMYIMTSDGLYIQTIGGHRALVDLLHLPKAERGMDVSDLSFDDEHFHPTVTHTVADDQTYMVAGKEYSAIFRLDGLETVKRQQFGDLTVTAAELAGIPARQEFILHKEGHDSMDVVLLPKAPVVDGKLDDWTGASWVDIGTAGKGVLAINGDRLYAAWQTTNPKVLANTAADPEFAFKRGGAVDLLLGPSNRFTHGLVGAMKPQAGDQRLLACMVNGKKLVVLYRQVAAEQKLGKPVLYESPIGKVQFEDVAIITNQVSMAQVDGNVELSIPLKLLGLNTNVGESLLGDMGILRGSGSQTTLRTYWKNMDTAMVSDIPTEARLVPANWGKLKIIKMIDPTPLPAQKINANTLKPGLTRRVWASTDQKVPQADLPNPLATAVVPVFNLDGITLTENYACRFDGYFTAPTAGKYSFAMTSDDGAVLWIDDRIVVDDDGVHSGHTAEGAAILNAGIHRIRLSYHQLTGSAYLDLQWTAPGQAQARMADTLLKHTGP